MSSQAIKNQPVKNKASINDQIYEIAVLLNQSYEELGDINRIDDTNLPSHLSIEKIADNVVEVLFPGFICEHKPHSENLSIWATGRINSIFEMLNPEIMNSMKFVRPDLCGEDCSKKAKTLTLRFLKTLPHLRKILATDIEAAYYGDPAATSREEIILCYPGVYAVILYRIAHELHKLEVPLIPRMLTEYAHRQTGIDIHPNADIGKYFFIDHGTGVVIGATTIIGENVKIYQNVTLGALSFKKDQDGNLVRTTKRHPTLRNNVIIYAGSTLLGGDTIIGNNCVIGGNLWISSSIADNTTMIFQNKSQDYKIISDSKK